MRERAKRSVNNFRDYNNNRILERKKKKSELVAKCLSKKTVVDISITYRQLKIVLQRLHLSYRRIGCLKSWHYQGFL